MISGDAVFLLIPLALIPAFIANMKGRHFGFWWLYGMCLLPVAFFHAWTLIDEKDLEARITKAVGRAAPTSVAGDLQALVDLRDQGVLTPAEFERQKQRVLIDAETSR